MTAPRVSVIVPTLRRFTPLLETLADLLQQDYAPFEVVVADQNPAWPAALTASLSAIKADARVRWLTLASPGVVAARNAAVAASTGDVLLFVDDDVLIPSRSFVRDHAGNYAQADVAAVAGRIHGPDEGPADTPRDASAPRAACLPPPVGLSALQQAVWFDRAGRARQEVCTFCTCNGSVRRAAFFAVAGFDELFTGASYGDDADFALRLHQRHLKIVYDPAPWLIHRKEPIGGLRLSDRSNTVDRIATAQGFWLFVLRHGHLGMYRYLVFSHVLRKTVLMKQNVYRPWRQVAAIAQLVRALPIAYANVARGPQSRFSADPVALASRTASSHG
jgi:glycosyltransferase involved in cell wall biosynthesis